MADALKRLAGPTQPGTVTGVLLTVPANKRYTIKQILLCNTTAAIATVTIGIGGTAAASRIVSAKSVAPNETLALNLTLPLEAAETLDALQGTASAITVTVSGINEDV